MTNDEYCETYFATPKSWAVVHGAPERFVFLPATLKKEATAYFKKQKPMATYFGPTSTQPQAYQWLLPDEEAVQALEEALQITIERRPN